MRLICFILGLLNDDLSAIYLLYIHSNDRIITTDELGQKMGCPFLRFYPKCFLRKWKQIVNRLILYAFRLEPVIIKEEHEALSSSQMPCHHPSKRPCAAHSFLWRGLSASSNLKSKDQPLSSKGHCCFKHIQSYFPHLEAEFPVHNRRRRREVVTSDQMNIDSK